MQPRISDRRGIRILPDSAIDASDRGWAVVAMANDANKHPVEKWKSLGYRDAAQLRREWPRGKRGVGVLTGPSGLVVIDLDVGKPSGVGSLRKLAEGRPIPPTFTLSTPSGGRHLVFRVPEGREFKTQGGQVGPHIDVRGRGGLFVLDSGDPGKPYRVTDDREPAELPRWLADLLPEPGSLNGDSAAHAYGEPSQHDTLRDLAWKLRSEGRSERSGYRAWRAAADEMPLLKPDWPWTRADFDKMWRGADEKLRAAEAELDGLDEAVREQIDSQRAERRRRRRSRLGRILSRSELAGLPKPEPLIDGWLELRTTVVVSGDTGTYKTFTLIGWACSIATGEPWLGCEARVQAPVILVVGEGGSGLDDRITAWEQEHGLIVPDDMLTVLLLPDSVNDPKFWKALSAKAGELGARFVALDTFSSLAPDADEVKDSAQMIRWMTDLAAAIDGTVILAHHTGWIAKNRTRGGSQLEANPDSVVILQKPDEGSAATQRSIWRKKAKEGEDGLTYWVTLKPMDRHCVLALAEKPESPDNGVSEKMLEDVWAFIDANQGCSQKLIRSEVPGRTDSKIAAIELLERAARIRIEQGPRNSTLHFTNSPKKQRILSEKEANR